MESRSEAVLGEVRGCRCVRAPAKATSMQLELLPLFGGQPLGDEHRTIAREGRSARRRTARRGSPRVEFRSPGPLSLPVQQAEHAPHPGVPPIWRLINLFTGLPVPSLTDLNTASDAKRVGRWRTES